MPRRTAARAAVFIPGARPPAWMMATRLGRSEADGVDPVSVAGSAGGVDMVSNSSSILPKLAPRAWIAPR